VEGQLSSTYVEQFFKKNNVAITNDLAEASMIFFWACGLTEKREKDSLAVIRDIQRKMNPTAKLVVWGCLPRINPQSLATVYNGPMIGPDDKNFFESTLERVIVPFEPMEIGWAQNKLVSSTECGQTESRHGSVFIDALILFKDDWERLWERARKNTKYFIRVASGCTGRCTYCSERCAFGRVKSRPVVNIVADLERALAQGYNRFSLIATDLGAYGKDIGCTLPDLLEKMIRLDDNGNYKIILNQVNPFYLRDMFSDLEGIFASGRIETLNCPVQSGSERILKLMGRPHTAEEWRNYMVRINRKFPGVKLSTHFMVGFPSENDGDFKATLKLLDYPLSLDSIVIFKYSGRPRVYATRMSGQVSEETKESRSRKLLQKFLQRYISDFAIRWTRKTL
jgi:MiaB/RimO family radical SAM methylthiotransferase